MVKPEIPVDFSIQKDDDESVLCDLTFLAKEKYEDIEFLISLIKNGLPDNISYETPTCAGIHSLLSNAEIPLKRVAFLPVSSCNGNMSQSIPQ